MDRIDAAATGRTPAAADYQGDFYLWTQTQAAALRRAAAGGAAADVDWENVAEEIDSLGRSERSAVDSHLRTLMEHLLKLTHSPAAYPRGDWMATVARVRDQLDDVLTATLRRAARDNLATNYQKARRVAALGLGQDGLSPADLPVDCPWTLDQLLDGDFWPPRRGD